MKRSAEFAPPANHPKARVERLEVARLNAVAGQDRKAFDQLYREYYPRLMDFLARVVGNPGLAEEIVNDTMYVVWSRAGTFAKRSRVSTWVFGIAYKQAVKRLEREGRRRLERLPENWESGSENVSIDDEISTLHLQESLEKAMRRLSPNHRSVVELTYHFGYSYIEIAEIMGCPVNTVKTRMFHARARLRRILETLARRER
ncbi:MAG: RNA polymerase sigma factor [Gammaproteobacteria bacterium]|nr:RNA polymerase sigma factor [Gammaproteobacteria bacterium]HJP35738.1 RNA polymerase sigma factor [Gammaproteobacteria bacterium]